MNVRSIVSAAGADTTTGGRTASTRDRILSAARESIVDHGLGRTSMVDIARNAGVGRTTVYRHWKDLNALLADLMTKETLDVIADVDLQPAGIEEFADSIAAISDATRRSPLLDAIRRHEPELLAVYSYQRLGTSQRYLIDLIAATIDRIGETDERLARRDTDVTATMILVGMQGLVLSSPIAADRIPDDRWREEYRRLALGYLLT